MRKMQLVATVCAIAALMGNARTLYSDSAPPSTSPFAPFPTTRATTADEARWQLLISRPKAGQRPVNIEITLKNTGPATMKFPLELAEIQGSKSFTLQIRRPDGSALPLTLLGHQLYEPDVRQGFEFAQMEIGAGQSFSATLPADRIFDLSLDGSYQIIARALVWHLGGNYCVPIKSNELVVTLQPGLSKSR